MFHARSWFAGFGRRMLPVLVLGLCTLPVLAQPQQPANGGQGQGGFDPARGRQMMIDRLKEMLGASDEEMQALQPKIEKVMQLQRDAGTGGMRALFGRGGQGGQAQGGQGGPGGDQPQLSSVQQKAADLKAAMDANAPAAELKAKMQALRDARAQAKQDLAKAQAELKDLLTQKQEATLLMLGMLE